MNRPLALDRIRVVLSRTSHPGNSGAAARAMKTMGLRDLWLVAPEAFPDEVATARASGAADLLESARVVGTLQEALADTVFSAALTARRRELSLPRMQARDAAGELVARSEDGIVALVFGNETSGMTNEEVGLCSLPVTIPTDPDFSSLNLGAAVQVLSYELRCALLGDAGAAESEAMRTAPPGEGAASHAELEGFFAQLGETLDDIDFHKGRAPDSAMRKLRRLFLRAGLNEQEVRLMRGILADAQRMAGMARTC